MLKPRRRAKPISQAGREVLDSLLARLRALYPRKDADQAAAREYQQVMDEIVRHDDTNIWLETMDVLAQIEAERKKNSP